MGCHNGPGTMSWTALSDEGYEEGKEEGQAEGPGTEGLAEWPGRKAEGRGPERGPAEGREEGRAEGREEGRAEGVRMSLAKMILKGLPDDVIKEVTGYVRKKSPKIKTDIALSISGNREKGKGYACSLSPFHWSIWLSVLYCLEEGFRNRIAFLSLLLQTAFRSVWLWFEVLPCGSVCRSVLVTFHTYVSESIDVD